MSNKQLGGLVGMFAAAMFLCGFMVGFSIGYGVLGQERERSGFFLSLPRPRRMIGR
jgi:hypothetical protein